MKFFLKKIKGKCIIFNIEFSLFNISALFNDNKAEARDNLATRGTVVSLSIFAQDSFNFFFNFSTFECDTAQAFLSKWTISQSPSD